MIYYSLQEIPENQRFGLDECDSHVAFERLDWTNVIHIWRFKDRLDECDSHVAFQRSI